jgi:hypothetical protein
MAQRKPYMGFTAGQQGAEPEWLDVWSRPTSQQAAENAERVGRVAQSLDSTFPCSIGEDVASGQLHRCWRLTGHGPGTVSPSF